jgi:DNA-binding response OmpR family regulator
MNILIVEQDPEIAALLVKILQEERHSVEVASTLERALRLAELESFKIAILSPFLPDAWPITIIESIRRISVELGIIVVLEEAGRDTDDIRSYI